MAISHLYLYSMDGKTKTQITKGNYEVTDVNGVDEVNKMNLFYHGLSPPDGQELVCNRFCRQKNNSA